MANIRTIAISTGGGDCPGLNAVIRAAVKTAILKYGYRVVGIRDGYDGLIYYSGQLPHDGYEGHPGGDALPGVIPLGLAEVRGILPRGGTILGTTNRGNPFQLRCPKAGPNGTDLIRDVSDELLRTAYALEIDAVLNIGGDGTQRIGLGLSDKGLPLVGVPKTIDNDLMATDTTFGFDSAVDTATAAIDKLHTTAESHKRIMLVELMGRDAGWLALHAGVAGGAHVILLPEIPFTIERICESIQKRDAFGRRFTIIAVAEGIRLPSDLSRYMSPERQMMARTGPVSNLLGEAIAYATGREARVTILGHTQRGGSPSAFDRILGTRFGVAAVDLIAAGKFGHMVALRGTEIISVPLREACLQQKLVDPGCELVRSARAIGISFGA
jgi:6-phosphofructokinase 1